MQPVNPKDAGLFTRLTELSLDLTFTPVWDYIPLTREYVRGLLESFSLRRMEIEKILIILSEMLENGVKYSNQGQVRLTMQGDPDERKIEITVYNRAQHEHAEFFCRTLEEMRKSNPKDYYLRKLKESVHHSSGRNQIGLARIQYETGARLSARYLPDHQLEVKAIMRF